MKNRISKNIRESFEESIQEFLENQEKVLTPKQKRLLHL